MSKALRVVTHDFGSLEYQNCLWFPDDDGSLKVMESDTRYAVARFAKGVWAYVEQVND